MGHAFSFVSGEVVDQIEEGGDIGYSALLHTPLVQSRKDGIIIDYGSDFDIIQ
jgi:hypothetical protein